MPAVLKSPTPAAATPHHAPSIHTPGAVRMPSAVQACHQRARQPRATRHQGRQPPCAALSQQVGAHRSGRQ
eukprot:4661102-Prymnesium_polylepis.2